MFNQMATTNHFAIGRAAVRCKYLRWLFLYYLFSIWFYVAIIYLHYSELARNSMNPENANSINLESSRRLAWDFENLNA